MGDYGNSMIKASGPSISMVENKGSNIGNFKGVMLCNRPFHGMASKTNGGAVEKNTFSCGVVPDALGINVAINTKEKAKLRRPKKETVLTKHKKWLHDLQKEKDRLEIKYMEDLKKKEDTKLKFQINEAKMRQYAKEVSTAESDSKYESSSSASPMKPETNDDNTNNSSNNNNNNIMAAMPKLQQRPAWAMTEEETKIQSEAKELFDENELLDFAKNLDYDRYIADMEVKQMMQLLAKRIKEMEIDISSDYKREQETEERQKKRELLKLMGESLNNLTNMNDDESKGGSDEIAAAKAVLQGDDELQAIHSTKSVVAMIKAAREKGNKGVSSDGVTVDTSATKNEPVIVTHEPSEGSRVDGKNTVSNLPYLRRNPAV